MKHIVLSLLVSLVSLGVYADDDLVEYCRVNFKQDFTVYADYGEQSSSFYSQHKGRISKNKWDFDDEVLFFASNKKNDRYKDIAVWTSDDDDDYPNVLFYDPSVDKEPGATIRIDYDYQGHRGNAYYGDITYYVYKSGQWSESVTKTLWTHYTSHKAYAVFEHEDDDDELHNLRCGPLDEKPVVPDFKLDICPYVPNTVQTNYILPSGNPFGALQVGASNYVQLGKSETELFLSSSTGYNDCIDGDGNLVSCKTMLTNTKPAVDGFPKSLGTFPNTGNKPDKDCKKDNLRDCYLTPGVYKDVKVAEDATLVLAGGRYYFSILKFEAEGASLQVNGPTEINYKEILFEKSDIKINVGNNAKSENLLFLGHGDKANFYLKSGVHNVEINAYIYVDKRADDKDNGFGVSGWRNTINGGVTSHSIAISGGSNYINATNQLNCTGAVEPDISAIEIVPTNMYLQCADNNKVYVKVFDKDGKPIQNIGNSLVNLYSTSPNALSFTRVKYDAAKSWFEFTVDSKANNDYGPIEVKANVVGHDAISDTSHLVFAPVVFDINDGQEKELIAGYPDKVSIKALACSTDGNTIVGNYEKTISEKNLHNTSFIPGSWQNNSNKLTLTAGFKAGQVAADIQFNDAGRYKGQLIDTVKCQDFYRQGVEVVDCPITESKQIIGELKFKARPWSFALCRPTLKPLPNGDIDDPTSEHFVAAGESFAFAALPIRWQGGNITGEVATLDSYCDKGNITENFSLGQAGEITLKVTHDISLPSGGELGDLSGNVSKTYTASEQDGYYLFDSLSWNEVGQLKLMVDSDDYWDMDIQQGYRNVGRFYPYRFAINKSEWQAPASQGDVTYLSQPFANVAVKVEAVTLDNEKVKNYDDFAEPLQAKFTLWQESNSFKKNELQLNVAAGQWREDSDSTSQYSYWELDDSNAKVLRYRTSALSAPLATKENGPFNTGASGATSTDYALQIDGIDPVFFLDEEGNKLDYQAFIYQPKLRYGRMVLGHLGGVSGTNFNVPLRVEYWNGSKFVVNQSDDASGFLTTDNYQCKKPLWQSTPSNSTSELAGADSFTKVKDGLSDALMANADSDKSLREQVQFWLKLDDLSDSTHASPQTLDSTVNCGSKGTSQPWLQYNWHGLGDEDPSTVITFGIYRGNDKIIFRSEEGLTGL